MNRMWQTYLGLLSVFALLVIGGATYVWQSGQITTSADQSVSATNDAIPVISLSTEKEAASIGDALHVDILADFQNVPTVGGTLVLSIPVDQGSFESIDDFDGPLGKPTVKIIDPVAGLATLTFSPLQGTVTSQKIGGFTVKAKAAGQLDINFEVFGTDSVTYLQSQADRVSPVVFGTTITVN